MKLANRELDELLDKAGLRMAQPYSPKQSYRKDDYMLTACKDCGVEAHYKLKYILDKNSIGESLPCMLLEAMVRKRPRPL